MKLKQIGKYIINLIKQNFSDTFETVFTLLKIMIPVSIITKIMEVLGLIDILGKLLNPVMELVGLPGEFGLVWASTIITNIYGGIIVFFSLLSKMDITIAQVTVLSTMMLIAHTFPIENIICRKAGVKFRFISLFRIVNAFMLGLLLNYFFKFFNLYNKQLNIMWKPEIKNETIPSWAFNELKNYLMIFIIIFALLFIIKIFKKTGLIKIFNMIFNPILRIFGISKKATPITIIGMTLGLAYGGGLIIKEAKDNKLSQKDVFFSLAFLSLSHSLIEDTFLMLSMGASLVGIFFGRLFYTIIVIYLLTKFVEFIGDRKFRYLFMKEIEKDPDKDNPGP